MVEKKEGRVGRVDPSRVASAASDWADGAERQPQPDNNARGKLIFVTSRLMYGIEIREDQEAVQNSRGEKKREEGWVAEREKDWAGEKAVAC